MKTLRPILYVFAVLIILYFIAGLVMGKELHSEASITIDRPVSEVYDYVKYLKNMNEVGVWQKADPNIKLSFEGNDGTVGFISKWEGNKKVGVGEQEITEMMPDQYIKSELRFEKPYKSVGQSTLTTVPEGGSTIVTWSFDGDMKYPSNVMIPSLRKQMNKQLLEGLENLKNEMQ